MLTLLYRWPWQRCDIVGNEFASSSHSSVIIAIIFIIIVQQQQLAALNLHSGVSYKSLSIQSYSWSYMGCTVQQQVELLKTPGNFESYVNNFITEENVTIADKRKGIPDTTEHTISVKFSGLSNYDSLLHSSQIQRPGFQLVGWVLSIQPLRLGRRHWVVRHFSRKVI